MNSKQLFHALMGNSQTEPFFDGVFAIDQVEDIILKPRLIIVNTEPSHLKGEHWLGFFFRGSSVDIFDSLGKKLSDYKRGDILENFVQRYADSVNTIRVRLQPQNTDICGEMCLYFSYFTCLNESLETIAQKLNRLRMQELLKIVHVKFFICERNSKSPFVQICCRQEINRS